MLEASGYAAGLLDVGQFVALVEFESRRQDPVAEPQLGEGQQKSFIKIVSDSSAVLGLSDHVAHRRPRYPCEWSAKQTGSLVFSGFLLGFLWGLLFGFSGFFWDIFENFETFWDFLGFLLGFQF